MSYKRRSPLPIVEGGTNATSVANSYGVMYYTGSAFADTTVGTSGQILKSNGSGTPPSFQNAGSASGNGLFGAVGQGNNMTSTSSITYISPSSGVPNATASLMQFPCPVAGTFSRLYVRVISNASTTNVNVTFLVNSVASSLVVTIPATTTGIFTDLTHSVAVSAGDLVQFKIDQATTGNIMGKISGLFNG